MYNVVKKSVHSPSVKCIDVGRYSNCEKTNNTRKIKYTSSDDIKFLTCINNLREEK